MLRSLANELVRGVLREGPIFNAVLEAFLIHARALTDFFLAPCPRAEDMVAGDFFSSEASWSPICPVILGEMRQRAGKRLAHLSYKRLEVTPDDKPWPVPEILSAIDHLRNEFRQQVPAHCLSSEWHNEGQA